VRLTRAARLNEARFAMIAAPSCELAKYTTALYVSEIDLTL